MKCRICLGKIDCVPPRLKTGRDLSFSISGCWVAMSQILSPWRVIFGYYTQIADSIAKSDRGRISDSIGDFFVLLLFVVIRVISFLLLLLIFTLLFGSHCVSFL